METVEQVDENFNVKKPKKKGALIGGIIAVIVVISLVLIYFLILTKPQFIFSKAIDRIFKLDLENYDSIKVDTKIKASVEAEDATYDEYLKEIEKVTIKAGTQLDISEKKEIVELGLEYDNETVADAQIYYNDGEMYAYLEGLFDKYIEMDMDEETKEQLENIFENTDVKNEKIFLDAFKDELKAQIKEKGKYEKKKTTIEVEDEEVKVTKNTYIVKDKEAYKMLENIVKNLGKNEKILSTIEKSKRKEFKEAMEQIASSIEETATDDDITFKISLYTKGLLNNKLVAADVEVYSEQDESTVVMRAVKENEGVYTYNIFAKVDKQKNEILKGKIEIEKDKDSKQKESGKITLAVEIHELGNAELQIDYEVEYDKGIDKINTKNSVNINELTAEDIESIMEKLMERPLIGEYLEAIMKTSAGTTEQIQLTTSQNEIKDYGYSVTYSVPAGFIYKSDYSTDYLKYYELEDVDYSYIDASVEISWNTEEEYITDEIDWDYEYYTKETGYYKNVNLSEEKALTVGDKQFKYKILSYDTTYDTKEQDIYVWYQLDDEHLFVVELEATDKEVTEDIIKGFLDINVKELD